MEGYRYEIIDDKRTKAIFYDKDQQEDSIIVRTADPEYISLGATQDLTGMLGDN